MEVIWKAVKQTIKACIPDHSYQMWIDPLELKASDGNGIVLSCPNYFYKKRINEQYGQLIVSEINRASGKSCSLSIEVNAKNGRPRPHKINDLQLPLPNVRTYSGRVLRKDFTFDQFVVGGNNNFAYSAALAIASQKNSRQNSLFLLSNTGMGKSHLSQAIGHFILSEHPSLRVYYITVEDFTNEMVHALRHGSIDQFKNKYRNQCDVLILEDVHYLTGKDKTQIELALTLDNLFEMDKRIFFSSCYLPVDIPKLNDKLRSRFACSLISNIDPPNFRTRIKILQKKTETNGYCISDDVIQYLASELSENVRQLESGLFSVASKSSLLGVPVDLSLAESVVKHMVRQQKTITIDAIKKLVCKHFRISVNDIVSPSRKQSVVRPRQIAIYLSRMYTDSPLQTIGKSFNRYHATALHSINVVEKEVKAKSPLKQQVDYFRKKLDIGDF